MYSCMYSCTYTSKPSCSHVIFEKYTFNVIYKFRYLHILKKCQNGLYGLYICMTPILCYFYIPQKKIKLTADQNENWDEKKTFATKTEIDDPNLMASAELTYSQKWKTITGY